MKRYVACSSVVLGIVLMLCWSLDPVASAAQRRDFPAGFMPGMRVVLLADEPAAGPGLQGGMAGTVLCCDLSDCTGGLLVSWDLWNGGQADAGPCSAPDVSIHPPGSTAWVDPAKIPLGRPFDKIGYLREGLEGCMYFEAEDGDTFNLVDARAFQGGWGVVRPGNYVRVRGLVDSMPVGPDVVRICPKRDGDVYHPIMSLAEWTGAPCCDRWICGFNYGDRVVLIGEDNPYGVKDLPRGAVGTIICCKGSGERAVLVSWDLWSNGGPDDAYMECTERLTGLFPPGSTLWVSPEDIAKQIQTDCGILRKVTCGAEDPCPALEWIALSVYNDTYYLPDVVAVDPVPPGEFQAVGLYTPYAALPGVAVSDKGTQYTLSGTILHSVVTPCPEPNCCEQDYEEGDRVMLIVDAPGHAEALSAGATGTVVCCKSRDPLTPILVSWDEWTGGHNGSEACDQEYPAWFPEDSGWWMMCREVEPLILPELLDAGAEYQSVLPSTVTPGGKVTITGVIANRGGTESGQFFVEVYASADKDITREDYRLGRASMEMDADGEVTLLLTVALPAGISAGTYDIGWIIDPEDMVEEIIETNNTVVIQKGQLIVEEAVAE